jgi:PncC family amidohydrolase
MYDLPAIETIRQHMISGNQTLTVAESVTSGHLQAALSLASEASRFFQGGITAYNLGQKARHLHVDPIHATACNSVSGTVADQMALNALKLFSSDWAIGITGYASPLPELGIRDLFAFYAIASRNEIIHRGKIESEDLGPLKVQVHFTNTVLKEFQHLLGGADHRRIALNEGRRAGPAKEKRT